MQSNAKRLFQLSIFSRFQSLSIFRAVTRGGGGKWVFSPGAAAFKYKKFFPDFSTFFEGVGGAWGGGRDGPRRVSSSKSN